MSTSQVLDLSSKATGSVLEVLDLRKEKLLLPSSQGKKIVPLTTGFQDHTDVHCQQDLNNGKQYFELLISTYGGDDPLKPKYDFVCWFEESCLNFKSNNDYISLLENIIGIFKDDFRYKQDVRLIEVIIKYIELQKDQVELYQTVFSQGLGTMCAVLYISWADALDRINDFKRANQVYETGIRYSAQPLEELKLAQQKFQLSFGRQVLGSQTVPPMKTECSSTRHTLSLLQKSNQVINYRVPLGKPNLNETEPLCDNSGRLVTVFQGENDENIASSCTKGKLQIFSSDYGINREHTPSAEPLKSRNVNQDRRTNLSLPSKFHVHTDYDEEGKPEVSSFISRILKPAKRVNLSRVCPLALFEPPDPKKKAMYPKKEVYAGGRELQLEELKAAFYEKKWNNKKQDQSTSGVNAEISAGKNKNLSIFEDHIDDKQILSRSNITDNYSQNSSEIQAAHSLSVEQENRPIGQDISHLILSSESVDNSLPNLSQNEAVHCSMGESGIFKIIKDNDVQNGIENISDIQAACSVAEENNSFSAVNTWKDLSCRNENGQKSPPVEPVNFKEIHTSFCESQSSYHQTQQVSLTEKQTANDINSLSDLCVIKENSDICEDVNNSRQTSLTDIKKENIAVVVPDFQSNVFKEKVECENLFQADCDTMDTFTSSQIHKPLQVNYENMQHAEKVDTSCINILVTDELGKLIMYKTAHIDSDLRNGGTHDKLLDGKRDSLISTELFEQNPESQTSAMPTTLNTLKDPYQSIQDDDSPVPAQKPTEKTIKNEGSRDSFMTDSNDRLFFESHGKSFCRKNSDCIVDKETNHACLTENQKEIDFNRTGNSLHYKNVPNIEATGINYFQGVTSNSDILCTKKEKGIFKLDNILSNVWSDSDSDSETSSQFKVANIKQLKGVSINVKQHTNPISNSSFDLVDKETQFAFHNQPSTITGIYGPSNQKLNGINLNSFESHGELFFRKTNESIVDKETNHKHLKESQSEIDLSGTSNNLHYKNVPYIATNYVDDMYQGVAINSDIPSNKNEKSIFKCDGILSNVWNDSDSDSEANSQFKVANIKQLKGIPINVKQRTNPISISSFGLIDKETQSAFHNQPSLSKDSCELSNEKLNEIRSKIMKLM